MQFDIKYVVKHIAIRLFSHYLTINTSLTYTNCQHAHFSPIDCFRKKISFKSIYAKKSILIDFLHFS